MTVQADIDALLTVLKGDILTVLRGPLMTFLTAVEPVGGVPPSVATLLGAEIQLRGALIIALPKLEGVTLGQLVADLQAKLAAVPAT